MCPVRGRRGRGARGVVARARTRKRRLVVERAEADGLARAKVLRILDI